MKDLSGLSYGEKLPSVREMLTRYRVGRGVLDAVLDTMEHDGVIRRVPYVGIFNNLKFGSRQLQVTLITPDWPSEVFFQLGKALENAVAQNVRFSFHQTTLKEPYFQNISEKLGDVLLLWPPSRSLTMNDFISVKNLSVPAVLMSRYLCDMEQHYTNTMPGYGGNLAAMHFLKCGHRKLAVLVSEPHIAEIDMRVTSFVNYCVMHDAEVEVIYCHTRSGESSAGKAYDVLTEYLKNRLCHFTALFVVSDASAIGALRALHECDVRIPGQVSVIGYDGLKQGEFYLPPLTTIRDNYDELARRLVREVERFLDGEVATIQVEQRPELLIRNSVAVRSEP